MKKKLNTENTVLDPIQLLEKLVEKNGKQPLFPKMVEHFKKNIPMYESIVKK